MIFCPNCGAAFSNDSKFCSACGTNLQQSNIAQSNQPQPQSDSDISQAKQPAVEPQQTTAPQQPKQANYPTEPAYIQSKPQSEQPSIAKAIVSIALGGEAVACTFLTFIYTLLFTAISYSVVAGVAFGFNFIMSIFIIPPAIISMIFGGGYLNSNATRIRGLAKAGKIMSIVSLSVLGFCYFLSLISCLIFLV